MAASAFSHALSVPALAACRMRRCSAPKRLYSARSFRCCAASICLRISESLSCTSLRISFCPYHQDRKNAVNLGLLMFCSLLRWGQRESNYLLVYRTIVCSNENAHASNQGSHQNIIPHLREPIIFGFLSEEEFVKSKDCKGCNSHKRNKPHCVKDPRHQELLERIPHNLMCFQLMTHEGYNKPRNNLQSNQPPFS